MDYQKLSQHLRESRDVIGHVTPEGAVRQYGRLP